MTTERRSLKQLWCDLFSVDETTQHSLVVSTPFAFGDDDRYPVMVERTRTGWQITDHGLAISHVQLAELDLTDARLRQIEHFAESHGCTYQDGTLRRDFDEMPEIEDIISFIKLITQIDGMPLHILPDREAEGFKRRARTTVRSWLPDNPLVQPDWRPPEARPGSRRFVADLWLPSPIKPVVAFFAGSSATADRVINAIYQFREWDLGVKSLLAHNGSLNSETAYAAVLALEDDQSSLVRVHEGAEETGYLTLHNKLEALGVPLTI